MPRHSTLATKITRAIASSASPSGHPWNSNSLSQEVNRRKLGVSVSRTYVRNLRKGEQVNPSILVISALARVLDVPEAYFLQGAPDDLDFARWKESEEVDHFLHLLMSMTEERRREIMRHLL